ncbi:MAG: hypothetical protein C7B45_02000 [Sulfobacillus acidophilus]|uniref:IstB-like ATP-binding domain-containing protein n=1 Tax=Sulfobacillus acidophilus TaxID=53633 RepID=A0A2T2WNK0_9FIRM|nr:MAG: hypothetical protein C7B45_02000 [Sulfobacillus acidophilus]
MSASCRATGGRLSLSAARLEHTDSQALNGWVKVDVLILDGRDVPLNAEQTGDLGEVLEGHRQRAATIFHSQVPVNRWHGWFADVTMDRCHVQPRRPTADRAERQGESCEKTVPPAAPCGTMES